MYEIVKSVLKGFSYDLHYFSSPSRKILMQMYNETIFKNPSVLVKVILICPLVEGDMLWSR